MEYVIKAIEFPDRDFETKEDLYRALKEHEDIIMTKKRVDKTKSAPWTAHIAVKDGTAIKGLTDMKEGFIYPIINTTMIMDSHNDIHKNGIWNRSLKEGGKNVLYAQNHDLSVGSIIGFQKDVKPFTQMVDWKDIGENFEGQTQALTFRVKVHPSAPEQAKAIINEKIPIQNSIRMQYIKMSLAINSDDPEFKEENKVYQANINQVANKETVDSQGYFWLQTEAKIRDEGSMVVFGSNSATPITYPTKDNSEPVDTDILDDTIDPSKDTQTNKVTVKRSDAKSFIKFL